MIIADLPSSRDDDDYKAPDEWTNHVNYIDFVPDELLLKILLLLSPADRSVLERVNRRLRRLTVFLVRDLDHLPFIAKLPCSLRRQAILKYSCLQRLSINESDALSEDFAHQLAVACPLLEEAHVVSPSGLSFLLTYVQSLLPYSSRLRLVVADVRCDDILALEAVSRISSHVERLELVFKYPTRTREQDLAACLKQLACSGDKVLVQVNPGEAVEKERQSMDDNDAFWDLYDNL